jgi:hypothetical protein
MRKILSNIIFVFLLILTPGSFLRSQINPNGGFETGSPGVFTGTDVTGWTMLADGTAAATFEIVNDPGLAYSGNQVLKITVDAIGSNTWEPQVFNTDFPVTSNTTYAVSAWAASENAGAEIIVTAGSLSPNYHEWGRKNSGSLGMTWTNIAFQFTTRNPESEPRGGIPIHFGMAANSAYLPFEVYLDDIEVTIVSTGVDDQTSSLPKTYSLSQNYPNPFNPSTTIEFSIPISSQVTLKIYDVLGHELTTLVNELKQPGTYTIDWDASSFPGGVYFYRLQAGSYTQTKKLVYIK